LAFSLHTLVDRRIVIAARRLPTCLTLGLLRLLALLADALNILSRIADLEGHLSLMKRQAKTALDKAIKSCGLMMKISVLEDKVSGLVAQVTHLKECDSFLVDFVESACEQLKCRFPSDFLEITAAALVFVFCTFQVLAYILLMKGVELPSESQLWRKYQKIRLLCGLTRGTAVLSFFYRIVLSTLGRLLIVAKDP
jgi:hypothetical protein